MINKNFNIEIYGDGFTLEQINNQKYSFLDGFTFNPTLFKKNNIADYLEHCKEITSMITKKPVSLEVIADDEVNMIRQAEILGNLSPNVYIKIPITFTNGASTKNVIKSLIKNNYKLNITAIFSLEQIIEISDYINDHTILSIFAGRLYDIGIDASLEINKIFECLNKKKVSPKVLWASPRMSYDIISAYQAKCSIITMTHSLIDKLNLHSFSKSEYSLETVKMFYNDALSSNYEF